MDRGPKETHYDASSTIRMVARKGKVMKKTMECECKKSEQRRAIAEDLSLSE